MSDLNDLHLLSGAYAVGALDDLERARFEAHLKTCADCRAEVAGLIETTTLLAETTAVQPPAHVRDAVLAGIATVRPLPPVAADESSGATSGATSRRRRLHVGAVAAAAAVVAAIGIGVVVVEPWDDGPGSSEQVNLADRVLAAPDAERVEQQIDGATATVVISRSEGRAVLLTEDMPAAPAGKVYELWLQTPDEVMVPAGLMPPGANQTVLLEGDASDAVGVGITIEPEGGSKEPHLPPVALIELA